MVGPLFEEPGGFDREGLAAKLRRAAPRTSTSAAVPGNTKAGWGRSTRASATCRAGGFRKRLFEAECLREYAETFPTVCGDFAFYQFPTEDFWRKLFRQAPASFRFAFKVPEQITCKVFPAHARYGAQAGKPNEAFLDAGMLEEMFLRPLLPHRGEDRAADLRIRRVRPKQLRRTERVPGPAGPVPGGRCRRSSATPWRSATPNSWRGTTSPACAPTAWRTSTTPGRGCRNCGTSWRFPDSATADFLVCRALLRRGRPYEDAVAMFSPYTEVQDPNPEARESMRVLIGRARENSSSCSCS